MKRILALAAMMLAVPAWGQSAPPSLSGYGLNGSTQIVLNSTGILGVLSFTPPSATLTGLNATAVSPGYLPTFALPTYTSGITATGSAGQSCTITITGGSTNAVGSVLLTGTNTIATGAVIKFVGAGLSVGGGFATAPTSGTASNGTATCSGTATVTTVLGAYTPLPVDANGNLIPGGAAGGDLYSPTSAQNYPNPYVASIAHLTNGASPVNLSAPGLTVNAVANAAAPTGGATDAAGQSVPASATNEAALSCIDSSGVNTTLPVASANVTTTGGASKIVWTYAKPTGCTSAYLWMKNTGSFAYYTAVSGTSYEQDAAYTTYTAAASYPGGVFPTSNTTGTVTLGGLTGYVYANGSSTATAATTIPVGALPTGTATNQLPTGGVITAAGPIGGAATVPVITYNAGGQLTAVTTAAITPAAIGAAASGAATTVNGQSCALGGSCTVTAAPNAAINLAASGAGGVTGNLPQAQVAAGSSTAFVLTDASSASPPLSFTSVAVIKSLNGNLATVSGTFTYPIQASPYQAKFNLPYTSANVTSTAAPHICVVVTSYATQLVVEIPANSSIGYLYTAAGNALVTNANLTGAQIEFTCNYLTQ